MKCWITVRKGRHESVDVLLFTFCLPSLRCEHIHYIWIQTELSNLHYEASCVIAIAFSSVCKSVCVFPCAILYNKCCIYSSVKDL